jgi:outer membrane receptor protein involved in Fe transport
MLTWQPLSGLKAEVAYTYSNFKYSKPQTDIDPNDATGTPYTLKDHWLPNAPQHQVFTEVEYEVLPRLTVAVNNEYQSHWYVDSQNSAVVEGYSLWGARVAYAWKLGGMNGDVSVSGRNLFDQKYIAFSEPDPDGNSYQPGPTHEVYGGLRIAL